MGRGKKLRKSDNSGLLDTSAADTAEATLRAAQANALADLASRVKPSRKTKGYAAETVDNMLTDFTHRAVVIPART